MLVVDASAALFAAADPAGFEPFAGVDLVAPPLLWSEATFALHALAWRGVVGRELAEATLGALQRAPIEPRAPDGLHDEAWRTADRLGWAKTSDAEYVALALPPRLPAPHQGRPPGPTRAGRRRSRRPRDLRRAQRLSGRGTAPI